MTQQHHGVPALLSLVIPGLGQLVKGHWDRALTIWLVIVVPWLLLTFLAASENAAYAAPRPEDIPLIMLRLPALPLVILVSVAAWIWGIVDAYRRPQ